MTAAFHTVCPRRRGRPGAFSLVEVTLALGVIGFALVAILGVLPVALNTGRMSIAQTRMASLANTLWTNLRVQPFAAVDLAAGLAPSDEDKLGPLNLRELGAGAGATVFASFLETPATAGGDADPRRLRLTKARQPDSAFQVTLSFDNQPAGLLTAGRMNRVTLTVAPLGQPQDIFRCASVISDHRN